MLTLARLRGRPSVPLSVQLSHNGIMTKWTNFDWTAPSIGENDKNDGVDDKMLNYLSETACQLRVTF